MANNIDEIRKEYPNAYKTWQKREEYNGPKILDSKKGYVKVGL